MRQIVISFGGSVALSQESDKIFFNKLSNIFSEISRQYKIYLIVHNLPEIFD